MSLLFLPFRTTFMLLFAELSTIFDIFHQTYSLVIMIQLFWIDKINESICF